MARNEFEYQTGQRMVHLPGRYHITRLFSWRVERRGAQPNTCYIRTTIQLQCQHSVNGQSCQGQILRVTQRSWLGQMCFLYILWLCGTIQCEAMEQYSSFQPTMPGVLGLHDHPHIVAQYCTVLIWINTWYDTGESVPLTTTWMMPLSLWSLLPPH